MQALMGFRALGKARQAKVTATLKKSDTVHTLGSASDTWGRTWTAGELSDANFRVRVTHVATNTSRDFSLDHRSQCR